MGWTGNAGKGWGGGGGGLAILLAVAAAARDRHSVGDVIWCVWRSWARSFCRLRSGVIGGSLIINVRYDNGVLQKTYMVKGRGQILSKETVQNPKSAQKGVQNPQHKKGSKIQSAQRGSRSKIGTNGWGWTHVPPNQCRISPEGNLLQDSVISKDLYVKSISWPVLKWAFLLDTGPKQTAVLHSNCSG